MHCFTLGTVVAIARLGKSDPGVLEEWKEIFPEHPVAVTHKALFNSCDATCCWGAV